MTLSSQKESLGPWAGANFGETLRQGTGAGADSDLSEDIRFLGGIAKLVRRRYARPDAKADPKRLAIFILHRPPAEVPLSRIPMLDNGLTPLAGRLWFVSPVVAQGHFEDLPLDDDEKQFDHVIVRRGMGKQPAVVFDPRTGPLQARFYPQGLNEPEIYEPLRLRSAGLDIVAVFDAMDRVYKNCLITPEAQSRAGKLWKNGEKWWASSKAEDVVQVNLKAGLTTAFPTCTIRHEQPSPAGRLDLEIEEADPLDQSVVTRHAILELKVLREFGETGKQVTAQETIAWVESGVSQAAAYRNDKKAKLAALCCFDMRATDTGDACFALVKALAVKAEVSLRRWFLYGTSSQYRAATNA